MVVEKLATESSIALIVMLSSIKGLPCNNGSQKGHKDADCWDKEKNKDKRPAVYKPKRNGNASGANVKFFIGNIEVEGVECRIHYWCQWLYKQWSQN